MKKILVLFVLVFMTNVAVGQIYEIKKIENHVAKYETEVGGYLKIDGATIKTFLNNDLMGDTFELKVYKDKRKYTIFVDPDFPKNKSPRKFMKLYKKKNRRLEIYNDYDELFMTVYLGKVLKK